MDQDAVRQRADAFCEALLAGNIDRAAEDVSKELRSNLGQLVILLPLPLTEASVESIDGGGSGLNVVLLLVGENDEVRLQTRWKDRDGRPTIVEASHVSEPEPLPLAEGEEGEAVETASS
jgi:hypothetical protein